MNELENLLDKYLAGETSLHEEARLKFLVAKQTASEYDDLKRMFLDFDTSKQTVILSKDFEKRLFSKLRYTNRNKRRLFQLSTISVAATILFAVGFLTFSEQKEAFVIEQGVRCDDMEKAVNYADEAINEAIAPLQKSLQSLEPIVGLDGALSPSFEKDGDSIMEVSYSEDTMNKTSN